MKSLEIKVSKREDLGKKPTRDLRKKDFIPCVMYGGEEVLHFTAHENDFRHLVYTPNVYHVKLDVDGKPYMAILKDIQFHPVTDKILSIDFYQIHDDKSVTIAVPVRTTGFAAGVKAGGQLAVAHRKLRVRGLINNLPDELTIDVTPIKLGQTLKVKDLNFEGIEIAEPMNTVVLSIKLTRSARSAGGAEETEEGEEAAAPAEQSAE